MSESLWISTAYIQFPQQPEQFSALLGFARDREDFKQIIADTLSHQDITCRYQLAPLEAETFFQRHGKRWLLNKAQNLLPGQIRVIPIPIENLTAEETAITATDYLLRYEILDVVPLDRQFGRSPKRFAPDEIFKLLWPHLDIPPNFAEPDWKNTVQPSFPKPYSDDIVDAIDRALFGEPLPELKCYMVFDAKQHKFWHPENFKCRCENLFQGAFGEETKDIAPYLVEVIPYPDYRAESELMGIFSNREALTKFNWYEKSGIFIHSRHDFDTVYQHLRHFPMIKDEREEWSFFRFYDPLVLRQYLEVIATHPEKLSKFFGYDKRIIHAFASGYDSSFHYYSLKALPKVVPAPIVLTDWGEPGVGRAKMAGTSTRYSTGDDAGLSAGMRKNRNDTAVKRVG